MKISKPLYEIRRNRLIKDGKIKGSLQLGEINTKRKSLIRS